MSAHAIMLAELTAFKHQTSVHSSIFSSALPTGYERKPVFFYSSFCCQFCFSWELVVLHSPTSCFLRFLLSSIFTCDVISSFLTASIYSNNPLLHRIARKLSLFSDCTQSQKIKGYISKSILMIQSCT